MGRILPFGCRGRLAYYDGRPGDHPGAPPMTAYFINGRSG
jgi:hypothetical protein